MLHTAAWCPEAIPILLANVLFTTAPLPNPPALRAAPFTKGGFWVPSFSKGGTGRISPAVSIVLTPLFGSGEGRNRMKRDWQAEELVEHWTVLPSEEAVVQ